MQVYSEEIKLKMGLDSSGVAQELRKVERATKSFGSNAANGFSNANKHAKEFKKGMKEILSDIQHQSPIIGLALKAAFSPIGVSFGAASFALDFFTEKLAKQKEEFDRFGKFAAEPIGNVREMLRDASKELSAFNDEFSKWLKSHEQGPASKITDHLSSQLRLLQLQTKEIEKRTGKPMDKTFDTASIAIQKGALGTLSNELMSMMMEISKAKEELKPHLTSLVPKSAAAASAQEGQLQSELQKRIETLQQQMESASFKLANFLEHPTPWDTLFGPPDQLKNEVQAQIDSLQSDIQASKKRVEKQNEAVDKEAAARKLIADKLSEAQKQYDELAAAINASLGAIGVTRQQLDVSGGADTSRFKLKLNARGEPIQAKAEDWLRSINDELKELNRRARAEGLNMVPKLPD